MTSKIGSSKAATATHKTSFLNRCEEEKMDRNLLMIVCYSFSGVNCSNTCRFGLGHHNKDWFCIPLAFDFYHVVWSIGEFWWFCVNNFIYMWGASSYDYLFVNWKTDALQLNKAHLVDLLSERRFFCDAITTASKCL